MSHKFSEMSAFRNFRKRWQIIARHKRKSMNLLAGKVAIVTGASKGIGAGIANALSTEGASAVVNYASSRQGADRVLAEIADVGGNAIAVQANVSDPEEVKRHFAETKKAFGKLDVLVNNAGVFKFEPSEAAPAEDTY
jgi:3-oxoacyl-[acyl-carrier protein] reductase